jgi:hypothetical protein
MAVLHRSSTPFERRQVACRLVVIAHPQPDTLDKERTEASTPPRKRKIRDPSASSSTPPQRQLSPSTIFPILSYTFVSISTYPHILHFSIIITNQHIRAQPSQGIQDRSRHMHISRFLGKKHSSLGICTLRQERNELNYLDRRAPAVRMAILREPLHWYPSMLRCVYCVWDRYVEKLWRRERRCNGERMV